MVCNKNRPTFPNVERHRFNNNNVLSLSGAKIAIIYDSDKSMLGIFVTASCLFLSRILAYI